MTADEKGVGLQPTLMAGAQNVRHLGRKKCTLDKSSSRSDISRPAMLWRDKAKYTSDEKLCVGEPLQAAPLA
eukprot:CAMPEP_0195079972 /NCGR_PEP_ID=MMETSP0448-20130528/21792_1 /TAXON_ID=66468 /ORGANISM="Heterocapsa triquestra, Strain CCMP 448" /LENGTH=71 /DNA_ID=CAMNT_0040112877 /DNA_START=46 /DNA_END=259 /DNA_ORIENTATION=-